MGSKSLVLFVTYVAEEGQVGLDGVIWYVNIHENQMWNGCRVQPIFHMTIPYEYY